MKKTILLSIFAIVGITLQVQSRNIYFRMSTNTTDWSYIAADTAHIVVDYIDGNSFNTLLNTYRANDTILVSKGTYTIDAGIALKTGQKLYGGFDGTSSSLVIRATSDLDGNGIIEPWEFTNATEITSSVPAAYAMTLANNSIVDGLTFKGINNTATAAASIISIYSSVTGSFMRNVTIKDCNVTSTSAAVYILNGSAGTIQNCMIQNNTMSITGGSFASFGGGLFLTSTNAKAIGCIVRGNKITNVVNTKAKGGGVFLQLGAKLINSVVYNNQTDGQGGGVFINDATSEAINCTVAKNKCGLTGGGVFLNAGGKFNNSIVWSNLENFSTTAISNDIYYGGTASAYTTDYLAYGIIEKATTNTYPALANVKLLTSGEFADNTLDGTNSDLAPKFKNPSTMIGAPADPSAILQANYKLLTGSPCLDFASNTLLNTLGITTDLMNGTRFVNTTADLGAYEFGSLPPTALNNIFDKSTYSVYRNGSNLVVSGLSGESYVSLYELNGTLLQNIKSTENQVSIPVAQRAVYIVKVKTLTTTGTVKAIF